MAVDPQFSQTLLPSNSELRVDAICDRFEAAWKTEQRPSIKEHIKDWFDPELSSLLRELLAIELAYRIEHGEAPSRLEYGTIFPQHIQVIDLAFAEVETSSPSNEVLRQAGRERPPGTSPYAAAEAPPTLLSDKTQPTEIARYRILELLGAGGFGTVYLAHDDQLRRKVAIKIPRVDGVTEPDSFLTEARILASLDHPNIVAVYDAGQTSDGNFYLVSKWIEGSDLHQFARDNPLPYYRSAELVAKIADALQYAHSQKLIHRDIKPANILIDSAGEPYLADFGLALSEDAFGRKGTSGGTAAYMSPEQARGEGHLVDGRSDIFSLGAVFYCLLTGERPFRGSSRDEVLERIQHQEARPPRQLVADLPRELERICLKALSREAKDRYTTAFDMADDLRHFLRTDRIYTAETAADVTQQTETPVSAPLVVPKGLRSFDRDDTDFFLRLLPGPFDRDGLPEAIRFWKTRIEETDADYTFRVGLIYGPTGCGRSSFVRAGLLPHLSERVAKIYVECNGSDDEQRLLRGLRKRYGDLESSLSKSLAAIRRGQGMPAAHKILIVLDQFEKWLHANRQTENVELIDALRQCDGERVQCLLLVRDDFWMATTGFMRQLDEPIIECFNSTAVRPFDPLHARNVLAEFGRSFGRLPRNLDKRSSDQDQFLDQAIADLARDGGIIPVRLTLFADMVKGKPWTPATLKQYGGSSGVTINFLEESFSAETAPLAHRLHERAARAVLRALLPETGSNLKEYKRSRAQLLEASGYREHPHKFDDLMRILDNETRLLTPIESASTAKRVQPPLAADTGERYYHLTHDYLVEPLREWLTRKEKETRVGRAMLALADQADLWNAKPENRRLPSLWEFMSFLCLTRKRNWPEPVRKMMRCALYRFTKSATTTLLLGMVTAWITYEWNGSNKATSLIRALDSAATVEVPDIATELARYDRWARPKLLRISNHPEANERHQIHANLVLLHLNVPLHFGPEIDVLFNQMLRAEPDELIVLRNALSKHRIRLTPMTWSVLESNEAIPKKQFRAACALALFDPSSPRWSRKIQFVAERLVAEVSRDPANFDTWVQAFAPLKERLLSPLGEILLKETGVTRAIATQIFASYAADNSKRLAHMLPDVDEEQFIVLFPRLQSMQNRSGAIGVLYAVLDETVSPGIPEKSLEPARDVLARRQANAAVALVRLGEEEIVWPLLAQQPDPRLRSCLIHRFGPFGADLGAIIRRLDQENVTSVRRALILILGEFAEPEWTMYERKPLITKLLDWYQYDNDPGIHASAEWVLRQWDQDEKLRQIDRELSAFGFDESRSWYVNREKQTMIVFRDPPVFLMGSPRSDPTRGDDKFELQHAVQLGHSFAMSAKQVTAEQFLIFASEQMPDHKPTSSDGSLDCPVNMVSWYDAARYCNWLSARHKLPQDQWCYEPNESNEYGDGMTLTPNYLERTGFRLPSEAEWEYACRAQSTTKRYYGESEELLGQYAWYLMNSQAKSLLPVGSLKPNDFGLFEMHGNLADWCQERLREDAYLAGKDGQPRWDVAETEPVRDHIARMVRGGNFMDVPSSIRSAHRTWYDPYDTLEGVGFRPTRTVISKAE